MLLASCSECAEPVREDGSRWECPVHGVVAPLWRPSEASYDSFIEHLSRAGDFATLLPWPMGPGWRVSDFGVVATETRTTATLACCSGMSDLDGGVDVVIVSEEPGTGLGARVAHLERSYPPEPGAEPPLARVRVGRSALPLWPVSTSALAGDLDRTVLVGEAEGRWLWIVLHPASAVLLLADEWILRDMAGAGAGLVELDFGGVPPHW